MIVNIENTNEVLNFGKSEQNKLSRLSADILSSAKANGLNSMDDIICDLIAAFDGSTKSKRFNLFRKDSSKNVTNQVMNFVGKLEVSYLNVLNNVFDMEKIFNEINLVVGNLKNRISEGNQFILSYNNTSEGNIERFKKVLHDLEISTIIATQMMVQVQTIIISDKVLVKKIKYTIQNTIPIWKDSNDSVDSVVEELKAVLGDCQNNMKNHQKLQLNPQAKEDRSV